ncbi:MAG: amidohydrolase [Saprospiraceae bacterium]|nr:amidohydrolase [Saprospiraceae bacterium]
MRLSIVQSRLHWESPAANRDMFAEKLKPLSGGTDLIVLPEMFTTGFTMNAAALAEPQDGPTQTWMQEQAAQTGAALAGSFICVEEGRYYNRLLFVKPDGSVGIYNKRHLFSLAGEHRTYNPGWENARLEWQGWRIRPLICYDLRFPVWCRNEKSNPFDLLLFVANWPVTRVAHWSALLNARAIENQAFVAGVNIFGQDGAGLNYSGESAVIDFSGQTLGRISDQEGVFTAELSLDKLRNYRLQFPFLADADIFRLP